MAKKLTNLQITRVALVGAGSNPHADVVLIKSAPVPPQSTQTKEPVAMKKNIDISKLSPEEQASMVALLAKSATDLVDPAPVEVTGEEAIIKSLPPEAQAILKAAKDRADEAVVKAEAAQTAAAVEKALREESAFVTKNAPIIKSFPGESNVNAALMYRISKAVAPADYAALEVLLKAGNSALASMGDEIGNSHDAPESGGMSEIAKAAKALQVEKGIPYSQALEETMQAKPELVQKMRQSKSRKTARRGGEDDED